MVCAGPPPINIRRRAARGPTSCRLGLLLPPARFLCRISASHPMCQVRPEDLSRSRAFLESRRPMDDCRTDVWVSQEPSTWHSYGQNHTWLAWGGQDLDSVQNRSFGRYPEPAGAVEMSDWLPPFRISSSDLERCLQKQGAWCDRTRMCTRAPGRRIRQGCQRVEMPWGLRDPRAPGDDTFDNVVTWVYPRAFRV